jgi:hypothetical protein
MKVTTRDKFVVVVVVVVVATMLMTIADLAEKSLLLLQPCS